MSMGLVATALLGSFLLMFHPDRPLRMKNTDLVVVASDGTTLSATLSWPRGKPLIGAVVLVHGSGPLTRQHVRGDMRSLVDLGFAVLHYDKRGAGASGGTYMPSSRTPAVELMNVLAGDAATVMDSLRARQEVAGVPCGFFGASQAGWIIPLAAMRTTTKPDFQILLSAPAVSTGIEGYYSGLTGDGSGPASITDQATLEQTTLSYSGDPGFDPYSLWAASHIRTLWLLGDRDVSVPTFATVRVLDTLMKAGHQEHTVVRFPNAGHDLRDAESGAPVTLWNSVATWYRGQ